ncbi:TIGR04076 family protein [Roseobacter sp. EG26]|uniref:TIGR04076 family protein n=1 Tax=Roseobacter sp. EG26 TaxID=3412477 RepID=UPI003CE48CEC
MQGDHEADGFWLYDLHVETVLGGRTPVCRHVEGEAFRVEGELLIFDDQTEISMYALAGLLPLLPAKQRETDPHDWMSTDAEIACPDPNCGGRFRVTRGKKRWFTHAGTTGLPEQRGIPYWQEKDAT